MVQTISVNAGEEKNLWFQFFSTIHKQTTPQLREKTTQLLKVIGFVAGATALVASIRTIVTRMDKQYEEETQRLENSLPQKTLAERVGLTGFDDRRLFRSKQNEISIAKRKQLKAVKKRLLEKWAHEQFGEQKTGVFQATNNTDATGGYMFFKLAASDEKKLN